MTQTIGQRLKAEREEQRLTLEKVFEATRIRIQYLQALEADDLSVMPSPVQARGYLRNYAEYLGLDVERILSELRAVHAQQAPGEVIGPADESPAIPASLEPPAPAPALESSEPLEDRPDGQIPGEQPASTPSLTVPIKPKSTRRKKADDSASPPRLASAEPTTRRRSRKKADPESLSMVEEAALAEALVPLPTAESVALPDRPAPIDVIEDNTSTSREEVSDSLPPLEAAPETIPDGDIEAQQEAPAPPDLSDSLWQSWLTRMRSILAARGRRRTLTQKDLSAVEEEQALVVSAEPETPEAENPDRPAETSHEILKEIGRDLRERRELLSLHLDEVERNTHVKTHYLQALERGALDELPSTVQTRGMLSNYATFLDLDVDALLLRFADALQARHRERNPQRPPRKPGQPIITNLPPVRSFIAGDMIFGVGMAVLLVGFAIWGVSRVMTIQSERDVKPTAPSISDVLLASPDPAFAGTTPTFLPVEAFPGEATVTLEIPTQNANAQVQLNLVAVERTYMRVTVDGEVVFDGRVVPGNAYPYEAEDQIEVLVGSGAAIRTVYNGRDLGLMGTFGQVVNNIYSGTEIVTPTALPTATATITPTPTNTVPPTPTSRFTATPVPSATAVP